MQFRRSAGIFVAGICLVVGGLVLNLIGLAFGTRASFAGITGDVALGEMAGFFVALAIAGLLLALLGLCFLIAAVHRALVKIDALPVGAVVGNRDNLITARR